MAKQPVSKPKKSKTTQPVKTVPVPASTSQTRETIVVEQPQSELVSTLDQLNDALKP